MQSSPRTPFLTVSYASKTPFITVKLPTLAEVSMEAKKHFRIQQGTDVHLLLKVEGVKMALTEGVWERLDELVGDRQRIELEVEEVRDGDASRGLSRLDLKEEDARSDTTMPLFSPPRKSTFTSPPPQYSQYNTLSTKDRIKKVSPAKSSAAPSFKPPARNPLSSDRIDRLKISIWIPCSIHDLSFYCNPATFTMANIYAALERHILSHDSKNCQANEFYCSRKISLRFHGMVMQDCSTTVEKAIEVQRGLSKGSGVFDTKRIRIEGIGMSVKYW